MSLNWVVYKKNSNFKLSFLGNEMCPLLLNKHQHSSQELIINFYQEQQGDSEDDSIEFLFLARILFYGKSFCGSVEVHSAAKDVIF